MTAENLRQIWAPQGFAHGFPILEQSAVGGWLAYMAKQTSEAALTVISALNPHGPRPISLDVLASVAADGRGDFKMVGTLGFPNGQIQQLHKPSHSADAAVAACEEQRKADS